MKKSERILMHSLKNADKTLLTLQDIYKETAINLEKEIGLLYSKLSENKGGDVRKPLTKREIKNFNFSLKNNLGKINNKNSPMYYELKGMSIKRRIDRLEVIRAEILYNIAKLEEVQIEAVGEHLKEILIDSYYSGMYEFYKQKDPKILELMQKHNVASSKEALQVILTNPWSGADYKKNITNRLYKMSNRIQKSVIRNIMEGKTIEQLSNIIADELGKDYKQAAVTLIHTETAYVKGQADILVYEKLDVEEYEFLATLDNRTSKECQSLDGKHFKITDAVVGKNYPPMHPRCRSTTISYRKNKEDRTRAARDDKGKTYKVPANMNYNEWYNNYVVKSSN